MGVNRSRLRDDSTCRVSRKLVDAFHAQLAVWKKLGPEGRVKLAGSISQSARYVAREGIRARTLSKADRRTDLRSSLINTLSGMLAAKPAGLDVEYQMSLPWRTNVRRGNLLHSHVPRAMFGP